MATVPRGRGFTPTRALLAACLVACGSPGGAADAGLPDAGPSDAGAEDGGCPDAARFVDLNGTACERSGADCRSPSCDNPCTECYHLVCQQTSTLRWELNAMLACQCQGAPPQCVDPTTCAITPNCP